MSYYMTLFSPSDRCPSADAIEVPLFIDKPRSHQPWQVAVLDGDGRWLKFEMELGRPDHVAAFRAGKVPRGVSMR